MLRGQLSATSRIVYTQWKQAFIFVADVGRNGKNILIGRLFLVWLSFLVITHCIAISLSLVYYMVFLKP